MSPGGGASRGSGVLDLTDEWELTFRLLDDTRRWRERSVFTMTFGDGDSVTTTTAYQIRLPLVLVREFEPRAEPGDWVRLLLPFASRSKHLLFKIGLKGAGGRHASLLRRREVAALQARYLDRLSRDCPSSLLALWEGVSAYSTTAWLHHLAVTKPPVWQREGRLSHHSWRVRALALYLSNGLGLDINPALVAEWLERTEGARRALTEALGEGEDPESSSECILLALPFMAYRPNSVEAVDILIDDFVDAVGAMDLETREVLAEYGRRSEAIVETAVPVDQSCSIKLSEDRPWVGTPSPVLEQFVPFGDTLSNHVEVHSDNHDIEIKRLDVTDLEGSPLGIEGADAKRLTANAAAFYGTGDDRPYFALIRVRARLRRWRYLLNVSLVVMTGVASLVAFLLPEDDALVPSLTFLTLPLTLAAAFILTRVSPLAERLLRRWRTSLMIAVGVLWGIALLRLWLYADLGLGGIDWL